MINDKTTERVGIMSGDYAKISADNTVKYGTDVSYYGSAFADRYTERTHFIFELLQNAEDALRWREEAEPGANFSRTVTFRLFPDHLEVAHSGLPFTEDHVRAICSIKRGTKAKNLNDIGKFGIGFKSVYAYTKRPEVHSGDEHFMIEHYVHPRPVTPRTTEEGQTLFYIPFDHGEIPAEQACAEISAKLGKLGFRTLLFLHQIESVDWTVSDGGSGSYHRAPVADARRTENTLLSFTFRPTETVLTATKATAETRPRSTVARKLAATALMPCSISKNDQAVLPPKCPLSMRGTTSSPATPPAISSVISK